MQFVIGRRSAHIHNLILQSFPFVERKRTVIHGARQTESVIDEVHLARSVAAIHGSNLRNGHVAFVDDHEVIFREIIEQTERPLSRLTSVEVTRVILNARAEAELLHHFNIIYHAFFHAFGFNELALLFEGLHLLHHVLLYFPDGLRHGFATGYKQICRVNGNHFEVHYLLAGVDMNRMNRFDFVSEKRKAHRIIGISQIHIHIITLNTKSSACEIGARSAVEAFHQAMQKTLAAHGLATLYWDDALMELNGVSDTINARYTGYDNHISSAAEQRACSRQAKLFNLVIDLQILFNVNTGSRNKSLGLVIVVVTDEVLDHVIGEKRFELGVKLSSQCFVVAEHQRGTLCIGNHIGHGERLSGTCNAQQRLVFVATLHTIGQFANGGRLVATRRVGRCKFKFHQAKVAGTKGQAMAVGNI